MDYRVLRPKAAAAYIGVGVTSLYEILKTGGLPQPIAITGNARGFPKEELDAFVDARKAERDAAFRGEEVAHA